MKNSTNTIRPILYRILADLIFVFHFVVIMIVIFGWLFPSIWYLYMFVLVVSLIFDIFLGYCILSKWEFLLRKKLKPDLKYSYSFTTYYTYRLTNYWLTDRFMKIVAITFLSLSILINIALYFLV